MPTVGVNLYADPAKKRLFVDVNNYDIEGEAGPITPAPSFETDIAAPPWLVNTQVRTLSPDGEIPAAATPLEGGRLTLTLGAVARYASVALEADTDGDGLSDAVEIDGEYGPATDPDHPDTDGDGLSDGEELREYGTDPANPDTDGDGHGDGAEVSAGADPTDPDDTPGPGLTLTGGAGAAAAAFLAGAAAYRLRQRAS
jgi:hypothetical protein